MLTPLKAIRTKCLDCCCGNPNEVRLCPVVDCPLYPYRDGHNPKRKGLGCKGGNPYLSKRFESGKSAEDISIDRGN